MKVVQATLPEQLWVRKKIGSTTRTLEKHETDPCNSPMTPEKHKTDPCNSTMAPEKHKIDPCSSAIMIPEKHDRPQRLLNTTPHLISKL